MSINAKNSYVNYTFRDFRDEPDLIYSVEEGYEETSVYQKSDAYFDKKRKEVFKNAKKESYKNYFSSSSDDYIISLSDMLYINIYTEDEDDCIPYIYKPTSLSDIPKYTHQSITTLIEICKSYLSDVIKGDLEKREEKMKKYEKYKIYTKEGTKKRWF